MEENTTLSSLGAIALAVAIAWFATPYIFDFCDELNKEMTSLYPPKEENKIIIEIQYWYEKEYNRSIGIIKPENGDAERKEIYLRYPQWNA